MEILGAPSTQYRPRKRKQLFSKDSFEEQSYQIFFYLLPEVLSKLHEKQYLANFVSFFELVAADSYPQDCIGFACWLDTIKWYTLESITSMVYRKDTKLFWCVVFNFFHGNAIRLFSGFNSLGTVLNGQGTRGYMIVPHEYVIRFLQ